MRGGGVPSFERSSGACTDLPLRVVSGPFETSAFRGVAGSRGSPPVGSRGFRPSFPPVVRPAPARAPASAFTAAVRRPFGVPRPTADVSRTIGGQPHTGFFIRWMTIPTASRRSVVGILPSARVPSPPLPPSDASQRTSWRTRSPSRRGILLPRCTRVFPFRKRSLHGPWAPNRGTKRLAISSPTLNAIESKIQSST